VENILQDCLLLLTVDSLDTIHRGIMMLLDPSSMK